jgi:hypothetical protein
MYKRKGYRILVSLFRGEEFLIKLSLLLGGFIVVGLEIIVAIFVVFGLVWIISLVAKFQQNAQQALLTRLSSQYGPNSDLGNPRVRERSTSPVHPQSQSQEDLARFRQEIERLQRKKAAPKPRPLSEPPLRPAPRVSVPPPMPPRAVPLPPAPPPPPPPSFTTLVPSPPPPVEPPILKPVEPVVTRPASAEVSVLGSRKSLPPTAVAKLVKDLLKLPAGPGAAIILAEILGEPKAKQKPAI